MKSDRDGVQAEETAVTRHSFRCSVRLSGPGLQITEKMARPPISVEPA